MIAQQECENGDTGDCTDGRELPFSWEAVSSGERLVGRQACLTPLPHRSLPRALTPLHGVKAVPMPCSVAPVSQV